MGRRDFVFATSIGTPLDSRNVTKAFQRILVTVGLPHQRFHDLRHACATLLLEDGEELGLVSRILGPARAFEWLASGRKLTAAEAQDWGLVSEVVGADELPARAAEVAARFAAMPTRGVGMTKRLVDHALNASLEEQLEREAQLQTAATQTADFREGVAAFLEKRPPDFRGI